MLEQNKLNCCCSITKSCLTLCDPMDCSTPGSSTISQSLLKFMSIVSVMLSNHLILCYSLLLLPSIFPSTRVFSSESALRIRWPKYGASTSAEVLAVSIQGWFPLGWTGLVSADQGTLKSLLQHHNSKASIFLVLSLLYSPTLTSVHDYWKNHSSNYMELCQQSDVSSF